jgi:hypothetical protein
VLERLEAGVIGQPVVGDHELEAPGREHRLERAAAVHERRLAAKAALGERRELELGVGGLVLQDEHAQRVHAASTVK